MDVDVRLREEVAGNLYIRTITMGASPAALEWYSRRLPEFAKHDLAKYRDPGSAFAEFASIPFANVPLASPVPSGIMVNLAQRGFSGMKGISDVRLLQTEVVRMGRTIGAEILASEESVASRFDRLLYPEERIVTIGSSSLCERALVNAQARGKRPSVTVLLASAKPETLTIGNRLTQSNVDVSYGFLADSMQHVGAADRVAIGAHLITEDGDVVSAQGADLLALAAKRLGKPVVVLAGPFKAVGRSTDHYSDYLRMVDLELDFTVDRYAVGTRDFSVVSRDLIDAIL